MNAKNASATNPHAAAIDLAISHAKAAIDAVEFAGSDLNESAEIARANAKTIINDHAAQRRFAVAQSRAVKLANAVEAMRLAIAKLESLA